MQMDPLQPNFAPATTELRSTWRVGELCKALSQELQECFNIVSVEGEISGLAYASSGHIYFSLKDNFGQLRCAMFRRAAITLATPLQEGDKVVINARVSVYVPRGDLQLIVESLRPVGVGRLYEEFLRLKNALQKEGLFDEARKRQPTQMPKGIALVTSADGAAKHDVLKTLQRRATHVPVLFIPTLVQGTQAADALCSALQSSYAAIRAKNLRRPDGSAWQIDVILLVRGGGSIEDLWAFNDISLARLIAQSPVPLITGIGHETDFTIADFCADVRASTPTAAAEQAVKSKQECLQWLRRAQDFLALALDRALATQQQRLVRLQQRLKQPSVLLARYDGKLQQLQQTLHHQLLTQLHQRQYHLQNLQAQWPRSVQTVLKNERQQLAQMVLRQRNLDPKQHLTVQRQRLKSLQQSLQQQANVLNYQQTRLERYQQMFEQQILYHQSQHRYQLRSWQLKLARVIKAQLQSCSQHVDELTLRSRMLDPQQVLQRGYSILQKTAGTVVRDASEVQDGEKLLALLATSDLQVQVQAKKGG